MYRASTPTHRIKLPMSKETIEDFLLTYADADTKETVVEFTIDDAVFADDNTFTVTFTQEQTNLFKEGAIEIQMRVKSKNGKVIPSKAIYRGVKDVLNDEVL